MIGKPSALALHLVRCLPDLWTGYDAMDDFPEFHSGLARQAMAQREKELCGLVDAVVVSSSFLAEKLRNHRPDLAVIRNAFDADVLPLPRWEPRGGEVFGYIGALGEWFDWGCVAALARSYPRADIRLIGPCLIPPPHRLPANVRILPPCPGAEVGRHLNEFRIGLIPFRQTPLTRGVDPIKYYEYRAVGLPVLSTTFGEMVTRQGQEGVYFLDGSGGIEASVAAALTYFPDPLQVETWRRENSWRHRFSAARLFL
ncbi:MAG: glycosyl transferase [Desulfuromonadales bacterium]|nr:glycosyl transferase [Desulfuromonadales bacterium]